MRTANLYRRVHFIGFGLFMMSEHTGNLMTFDACVAYTVALNIIRIYQLDSLARQCTVLDIIWRRICFDGEC